MITKATNEFPEIEWERGELIDIHDQLKEYGCAGVSADGRTWIGTWNDIGGDNVEIENIEDDMAQQYEEDKDNFTPCDNCDLPDACADFGCAIKAGLKANINW